MVMWDPFSIFFASGNTSAHDGGSDGTDIPTDPDPTDPEPTGGNGPPPSDPVIETPPDQPVYPCTPVKVREEYTADGRFAIMNCDGKETRKPISEITDPDILNKLYCGIGLSNFPSGKEDGFVEHVLFSPTGWLYDPFTQNEKQILSGHFQAKNAGDDVDPSPRHLAARTKAYWNFAKRCPNHDVAPNRD